MKTNILDGAIALSDTDLLARIPVLAVTERETTAELVAHLAALELRPNLYAAQGYGSLFEYCRRALRMSEDAACNRIRVTRVCRSFPVILDRLAEGAITLSALRMLGPHLTVENHEAVLARAANKRRGDIECLVAELAPKADVVASVRKVPVRGEMGSVREVPVGKETMTGPAPLPRPAADAAVEEIAGLVLRTPEGPAPAPRVDAMGSSAGAVPGPAVPQSWAARPRTPRPVIQASAPNRYRVQFTIGQGSHDKLRRLQALLRREVPSGDPGILFERMLDVYLEKTEKAKMGKAARTRRRPLAGPVAQAAISGPTAPPPDGAYETRIRRAADKTSRHIPSAVKRAVWFRDAGQCAFVSTSGRRCAERSFLELHHIQPYALDGPATIANTALRCRRHNQYEAEVVFGSRGRPGSDRREARP